MNRCKTCKYWEREKGDAEIDKGISDETPCNQGWMERRCKEIQFAMNIEVYEDSSVRCVKTDANFGCPMHSPIEEAAR